MEIAAKQKVSKMSMVGGRPQCKSRALLIPVSDLLGSIRKPELHAKNACIRKTVIASATIRVVVGSVAFEKQVRKEYRLQRHFRMSSSLKDPQCVAVRTGKHCSKTTAVLPLTQRVWPN